MCCQLCRHRILSSIETTIRCHVKCRWFHCTGIYLPTKWISSKLLFSILFSSYFADLIYLTITLYLNPPLHTVWLFFFPVSSLLWFMSVFSPHFTCGIRVPSFITIFVSSELCSNCIFFPPLLMLSNDPYTHFPLVVPSISLPYFMLIHFFPSSFLVFHDKIF